MDIMNKKRYYADCKPDIGFRCLAVEVLSGPFWDELAEDDFYEVRFLDEITVHSSQVATCVPANFIFDGPVTLAELPRECHWSPEEDIAMADAPI